ncbi:MAG TPA: MaoC family dehydratase [Alphaproteobacteria bacterium]|jgi:acyl dehydratase|nr:MaoC family dehydratase [Alphaproteobacteria bacterium]
MSGIRYLEDFTVGEVSAFGRYEVREDELLEFAREFDDQPFHTDPEAARQSLYGGLIASGWQTCAMMMRMLVDNRAQDGGSAILGSPGFDGLRWLKPVRPGDILSVRSEVLEVTPSRGKPDRGSIRALNQVLNQHGEVVAELTSIGIMLRRPASG